MEKNQKIELNTPDLLLRHHKLVEAAAKKAVHQALLRNKALGTPIVVSRNGKIVTLDAREIHLDSKVNIWDNDEDDVYAELLEK